MATRYCGLDFGTSNSTLALNADGRAFLCPLEGDSVLLPSAVFYDAEDHSVRYAIRNYVEGVEGRLLRALKSVLGSTLIEETTLIQRKRVAMRAIIGMFIRHLKRTAEARLAAIGMQGPLDSVVLGRPVHFVDGDEEADRRAAAELVAAARRRLPACRNPARADRGGAGLSADAQPRGTVADRRSRRRHFRLRDRAEPALPAQIVLTADRPECCAA